MGILRKVWTDVGNPTFFSADINGNMSQLDQHVVNPCDNTYGVIGATAGGGDETTKMQTAIDDAITGGYPLVIPWVAGGIKVSQLNIHGILSIVGWRAGSSGGSQVWGYTNAPVFNVASPCEIRDLVILGNGAGTSQDCVRIDCTSAATNDVQLHNLFLDGAGGNLLYVKGGANGSFNSLAQGVRFYGCVGSQIKMDGTAAAGNEWRFSSCISTPPSGNKPAYLAFLDNVGALFWDNFTTSPGLCTAGGFVVNSTAASAGVSLISGSVFEASLNGPSVQLVGSSGAPIQYFYFSNCDIGGGASQSSGGAVEMDYADNCKFIGGEITGNHDGIRTKNRVRHLTVSATEFQVLGKPFAFDSGAVFDDITVRDPGYQGSIAFWDSSAVTAGNSGNFLIEGGNAGTSAPATMVQANLTATKRQKVNVPGFNKGHLTTPSLAATTVDLLNPFMVDVFITITGGTVTVIKIDGTTQNLTSGTFVWPAGRTLNLTYSVAPTVVCTGI